MKVEQLMTKEVATVRQEESLNKAAQVMWDQDCGFVPVINENGRVVGLITDRDVCMAAYTKGTAIKYIKISNVMSHRVHLVGPKDTIEQAEGVMQQYQVRRLPVIGHEGQLLGILSLNDLALEFKREQGKKKAEVYAEQVAETLADVCEHHASLATELAEVAK